METVHRFRPLFVCERSSPPSYFLTKDVGHNCVLASKSWGSKVSILSEDGSDVGIDCGHMTCGDWPFVQFGTYRTSEDAKILAALITEVRIICLHRLTLSNVQCVVVRKFLPRSLTGWTSFEHNNTISMTTFSCQLAG